MLVCTSSLAPGILRSLLLCMSVHRSRVGGDAAKEGMGRKASLYGRKGRGMKMDSFPHAAQPFYSISCVWRSARKKANEACSQNGERRGRLCDRCKFRICPQGGQEKGASNMEVHQKRLHMKGGAPQFPVGKIGKGVFGWIGERGKGPSVANPFPYSWEKRGGGGPCIFHPSENPKSVSGLRERESKRWRERRGGGD